MVTGPATTWCYVSDMDRAVTFYRDVLGLQPELVTPYWSSFHLGPVSLGLHPAPEGSTGPHGCYGRGWFMGLQVEDVRALRTKLESAGVVIEGDFHDVPGGVVLDFVDPDGNTLEAFQPGVKAADLR